MLARAPGLEPRPKVLETFVLPLNYARVELFTDANIAFKRYYSKFYCVFFSVIFNQ